MFTTLILVIHIVVCIALILIILLQSGKGADIGAVFGGGSSQTVFGSTGATPFLSKVTIGAAVVFMVTSIILTYFSGRGVGVEKSIVTGPAGIEVPVQPGTTETATPQQESVPAQQTPSAPAATPAPAAPESKSAPAAPSLPPAAQPAPAPAAPPAESPATK